MKFLIEWEENCKNTCAEERATLCYLKIMVGNDNACAFYDLSTGKHFDCLFIPAVHLAGGIARGWWNIFGGRDQKFSVMPNRNGFALPDLKFGFDGLTFEVTGNQFELENPSIKFWQTSSDLERNEAESALSAFISEVVEKLTREGVENTEAQLLWSRIIESRDNPSEQVFCEASGAIGANPYLIHESDAHLIELSTGHFSNEVMIEFLAGLRQSVPNGSSSLDRIGKEVFEWMSRVESRPRYQFRLAELDELASEIKASSSRLPGERAWGQGYRAARAFRNALNFRETDTSDASFSVKSLSSRLGSPYFRRAAGPSSVIAAISRSSNGEVGVHLRSRGKSKLETWSEEFTFARAVGDALCFTDSEFSIVNSLKYAERQAVGRAFAAELLAPIERILDMSDGGKDTDEIAGILNVNPTIVNHQLENRDRIESACTVS